MLERSMVPSLARRSQAGMSHPSPKLVSAARAMRTRAAATPTRSRGDRGAELRLAVQRAPGDAMLGREEERDQGRDADREILEHDGSWLATVVGARKRLGQAVVLGN